MYRARAKHSSSFSTLSSFLLDSLRGGNKHKYYVEIPEEGEEESFTRVNEKLIFVHVLHQ